MRRCPTSRERSTSHSHHQRGFHRPRRFRGIGPPRLLRARIKDDADALDPDARDTDDNVVWLEEQTAGAAMAPGAITTPAAAIPSLHSARF